jgi:hypothetical protein
MGTTPAKRVTSVSAVRVGDAAVSCGRISDRSPPCRRALRPSPGGVARCTPAAPPSRLPSSCAGHPARRLPRPGIDVEIGCHPHITLHICICGQMFSKCASGYLASCTLPLWHPDTLAPWHLGTLALWHPGTLARLRREAATARSRRSPRESAGGRRRTPWHFRTSTLDRVACSSRST